MNARSDTEIVSVAAYAWAMSILVPAIGLSFDARVCVFASVAFFLSVAAALRNVRVNRTRSAMWLLLVGGAVSLSLPLAWHARNAATHPMWATLLILVGIGLYGITSLRWLDAPSSARSLVLEEPREAKIVEAKPSRMRVAFFSIVASIALLILFGPVFFFSHAKLVLAWPGLEREAEVLSAVVSVALATSWVGVVVSPAMRRPRARELPSAQTLRVRIATMSVCAIGFTALAWWLR